MHSKKLSQNQNEIRKITRFKPSSQESPNSFLMHGRKDSSDSPTYFETYPQNDCPIDGLNSMEYEREESVCPSIENGMIDNLLSDLKEEIRLKSEALLKAESYIQVLKQQNARLDVEKQEAKAKLENASLKIQELQNQIQLLTRCRYQGSSTKKSVTRTYVSERNIPIEDKTPLRLLSAEIFKQFTQSYQSFLSKLDQFIEAEKCELSDGCLMQKIQSHLAEIDETVHGAKNDGEHSRTTFASCQPSPSQGSFFGTPYNEYEQAVDMYKEHCQKLSGLLVESMNYIQELTQSLARVRDQHKNSPSPASLVPKELINIVFKECSVFIDRRLMELRMENMELTSILNQMVDWINRNSREGPRFSNRFINPLY